MCRCYTTCFVLIGVYLSPVCARKCRFAATSMDTLILLQGVMCATLAMLCVRLTILHYWRTHRRRIRQATLISPYFTTQREVACALERRCGRGLSRKSAEGLYSSHHCGQHSDIRYGSWILQRVAIQHNKVCELALLNGAFDILFKPYDDTLSKP